MRDDRLRLTDMLEAAASILAFVGAKTRQDLENDRILQSAVLHQLSIIGEAANHISADVRSKYPAVEWDAICKFRNVLVHQYFALDLDIVWQTVSQDIPELRNQLQAILASEFPG